jgi:hypothetical protein
MALKAWEVLLILIGGLVGLYFIYSKVDWGLPGPKKSVGQGENGENTHYWDNPKLNTTKEKIPETGGKRKRKRRRKHHR